MWEISSEFELGHRLDTPMSAGNWQDNNGPDWLHRTTWHGSIQSVTQFKFWTDFSHGNEVAYSCDQRLFFSSLTQLRRQPSVSIRKKYPLEPRVMWHWINDKDQSMYWLERNGHHTGHNFKYLLLIKKFRLLIWLTEYTLHITLPVTRYSNAIFYFSSQ